MNCCCAVVAPKKPLSAYFIFTAEFREQWKKDGEQFDSKLGAFINWY